MSQIREVPMDRDGAGICPFCNARNVEGAPVCRHYEGHDRKRRVVRFHFR